MRSSGRGNRTGFIDFSGNISWADDSDYQTQRTENGEYYIDKGLLSGAAEGSIGGGHWYYYCDGLYDCLQLLGLFGYTSV